ncbi:MAG: bifunctional folylpolyglutamate synthase/dihydrofolate synthase [Micavibrio sp.]|nr:bifunctional folylpolyglutamate synthase/dihydrofolate synthase [Micavibrio sp.]
MLDKNTAIAAEPALADWTFSPVAAIEQAINGIRLKHEPLMPNGLDRPLRLLAKLGNPHLKLPPVFHVAGTNGKGSSLAFVQAILEAGGHSVHKFISPHLVRFEERIIIAGKMIDSALLLDLIAECDRAAADEPVSFFEFFTALALLAYARHAGDAVLLETGLGGRFDATNVIPASTTLLTRISYDHMRLLGDTLQAIAENKAGIIKESCPVIVAPQTDNGVVRLFESEAQQKHAPLFLANRDWAVEEGADYFDYTDKTHSFRLPLPRLIGSHQVINAGTAIAAVSKSPFAHLLTQEILTRAMARVEWQGRMQRLEKGTLADLLPPGWELWVDGAHNDSGAEVLVAQAAAWGAEKPLHIITGFKRRKEPDSFYERLSHIPATIQAVDAAIDAPMVTAAELCEYLASKGFSKASPAANLESAIQSLTFQFKAPQRIIITGSLYLVGHALKVNNA